MRLIASKFIGSSVCTIRAAAKVGQVIGLLIDPNKLTIAGLWVSTKQHKQDQLLLSQDIRTIVPAKQQVIIDDLKDLDLPAEFARLKSILDVDYQIPGKKVIQNNKTIGQAIDFGFSIDHYRITNIVVQPRLLRRLQLTHLNFGRQQIKTINDRSIVVKPNEIKQTAEVETEAGFGVGYPAVGKAS